MKQLLRVALCSALFGWSTASLGYSGIVNGTLKTIIVFDNTYAFFTLSMALNTATGTPPCNVSQQFAINLSQPGGKAMVNQLLLMLPTNNGQSGQALVDASKASGAT